MSENITETSFNHYSGWIKRKGNRQGLWHKRFLTIKEQTMYIFFIFLTSVYFQKMKNV